MLGSLSLRLVACMRGGILFGVFHSPEGKTDPSLLCCFSRERGRGVLVDFAPVGVSGVKSTSLRSISKLRGCEPDGSRDEVLFGPGRMNGGGARGGRSLEVGELGDDEGADVAVVDMDTFDPPDEEE